MLCQFLCKFPIFHSHNPGGKDGGIIILSDSDIYRMNPGWHLCDREQRIHSIERGIHRNPDHGLYCMRCHNSGEVSRKSCNGDEDFDTIIGDSCYFQNPCASCVPMLL